LHYIEGLDKKGIIEEKDAKMIYDLINRKL